MTLQPFLPPTSCAGHDSCRVLLVFQPCLCIFRWVLPLHHHPLQHVTKRLGNKVSAQGWQAWSRFLKAIDTYTHIKNHTNSPYVPRMLYDSPYEGWVFVIILVEFIENIDNTVGMMWCQHHWQWCHWSKNHVVLYFHCHWLRNAVVSLITLLTSNDTYITTNSITRPKMMLPLILVVLPKECNGAIDDAICSLWNWYQWQWHQMTKNLDIRNATVLFMVVSTSHAADTNAMVLHNTNINASSFMWC